LDLEKGGVAIVSKLREKTTERQISGFRFR